jgi:zinc protease
MKAIKLVLENMKRIRKNSVSDEEVEDAKVYLIGSLPLEIETNEEVAENMATLEFYGLGLDYFDKYLEYIKNVTKEDILRVAQKYLHPERLAIVIVADLKKADVKGKQENSLFGERTLMGIIKTRRIRFPNASRVF